MKFLCAGDHFYKRFIEQIISFEETTLINDYLHYIKEVQFDNNLESVNQSTLKIPSKDVEQLQHILSEVELSKLYAHRFLDNVKKLLIQNGFQKSELNIRLGEYREYVMEKVQNIQINPDKPVHISDKLLKMERNLPNEAFINKRNQSFKRLCESMKDDERRRESYSHSRYEPGRKDHSLHESMNDQEDMPLEFLTHKRNAGNESALDNWKQFKNDLLSYIPTGITNEEIRSDIVRLHKMISSIKLEHASTRKEIQSILLHETPGRKKGDSYEHQQTRLRSLFHKMATDDKSHFSEMFLNKNFASKKEYLQAVEQRFNSIRRHLNQHLDYPKGKRSFNLNEVFRIMLYTELSILLTATVKNGNLDNRYSHLIDDYLQLLEKIHDYQETYNNDKRYDSHRFVRAVIVEDLFGRSKFDAMNIFSTLLKNMEDVMISTLNNSNYNYAALAISELSEQMIKLFDKFLLENSNLNRSVAESSSITNNHAPDINLLKTEYKTIRSIQNSLKSYTKNNSFIKNGNDNSMVRLFNSQKIFK